jgi:hypothetical protein
VTEIALNEFCKMPAPNATEPQQAVPAAAPAPAIDYAAKLRAKFGDRIK